MTLHTFPFCICGERWPEPYLWLLKGVTTALVGGTAVSARIDPPSTEELDNARCASSIPRSLVGHTKACTYGDELRRRRFTMLRGGESENERLHVWVYSSAIDSNVERGIGLPVVHSQESRPVMDQRCLNPDRGI